MQHGFTKAPSPVAMRTPAKYHISGMAAESVVDYIFVSRLKGLKKTLEALLFIAHACLGSCSIWAHVLPAIRERIALYEMCEEFKTQPTG
ncbi:hypothetical protein TNIN_175091 [Trichonephila inaurata madagascariensis]|uniref:Uncharacterized protein n=1 Tax=Trichonephila inaurata madagascariensis TaxID=2747483 RepID=A0A8X6XKG1_9ARAC|nr:hypothetical protein TNIN_175091 [Trichonephila inaurata madagascariensis]